jgi:aryl-alcohol dehydrogenase-like predicted oxidoreductase
MSSDKMKRREFVKKTLAGAGAMTLGSGMALAKAVQPHYPGIPQVTFGRTGVKISRLVAGTTVPLTLSYLKRAVDLGIDAYDLADCYNGGQSERIMGKFLEKTGLRKKLFLTTKSCPHGDLGANHILRQSLQRLRVNQVDMFFLHNLKDPDELTPDLKAKVELWKKQGKIRFFGFSTHAPRLVECMNRAAKLGWVDGILFKYNFRNYGDLELNKAIDACAKADIGMIAMKTQGSHFSFLEKVKPFQAKGFNQHQAVLQAVFADGRIHAVVSAMKGYQQLEENVAAAQDRIQLGSLELENLLQYGKATGHLYCQGCEFHCAPTLDRSVAVADTLRLLMYHDEYGEQGKAQRLFRELPAELRKIREVDFRPASRACPHGLDVVRLMERAADVFQV